MMHSANLLDEAITAYQNNNFEHAIQLLLKLIQQDPFYYDALQTLAIIYASQGDHNLAISFYSKASELKPNDPYLLSNWGSSYLELNQYSEALVLLKRAVDLEPHLPEFLYNLANCYGGLDDRVTAICLYRRAIELDPSHHQSYNNLGKALFDLNQFNDALFYFHKALELFSDSLSYLMNYANTLNRLSQFDKAIIYLDKALLLNPNLAEAWLYKGNSLLGMNLTKNAISHFDKAITINPNYIEALLIKASALQDLKNYHDAAIFFKNVLDLNPSADWALGNYVFSKMKMGDWSNLQKEINMISDQIRSGKNSVHPFAFLAMLDDPKLQLQCAKIYSNFNYSIERNSLPLTIRKDRKLRVGYYSADFNNHAVSFLTAELFELHDRNLFEIVAFSFKKSDGGTIRRRLEIAFDQFLDVSSLSDSEITTLSHDLSIDIAVDLGGFTAGSRPAIFANRAAPIQISYIGYLGTMGSPFIDYLIADESIIPSTSQVFYSEKVIYLPCYQVNDRQRSSGNKSLSREQYGLPNNSFVYCCFCDSYKISPFIFDSWMRILHAVPDSVLFLNEDNIWVVDNLKREAELRGISTGRLIFSPRIPVDDYLARYRVCDLFLDTTPYNAGTTASDALWMGLPLLTLSGNSFASRIATSILNSVGLSDLIVSSFGQYESLAIHLGSYPHTIQSIKNRLAKNQSTFPLFDSPAFTKNIESAFMLAYDRYQSGAPLDHIYIQ